MRFTLGCLRAVNIKDMRLQHTPIPGLYSPLPAVTASCSMQTTCNRPIIMVTNHNILRKYYLSGPVNEVVRQPIFAKNRPGPGLVYYTSIWCQQQVFLYLHLLRLQTNKCSYRISRVGKSERVNTAVDSSRTVAIYILLHL